MLEAAWGEGSGFVMLEVAWSGGVDLLCYKPHGREE